MTTRPAWISDEGRPHLAREHGAAERAPAAPEPDLDCAICPRLSAYRQSAREAVPGGHNAPVPSHGFARARLLVVGLAPGLHGANRTGRAFTGDHSGELLHAMLIAHGFARTRAGEARCDSASLIDCRITNAVRCVPPANKPTLLEIAQCRPFLGATIAGMPRLRVILALGRIAHDSTLRALDLKPLKHPFAHGVTHRIGERLVLVDSFHCSRYNINTGRLTVEMFAGVFATIRDQFPKPG